MIRYFEVLGLSYEVEYFGFMDTVVDRIVEIGGEQFFCSYNDFLDSASLLSKSDQDRLDRLVPHRIKQGIEADPDKEREHVS